MSFDEYICYTYFIQGKIHVKDLTRHAITPVIWLARSASVRLVINLLKMKKTASVM